MTIQFVCKLRIKPMLYGPEIPTYMSSTHSRLCASHFTLSLIASSRAGTATWHFVLLDTISIENPITNSGH